MIRFLAILLFSSSALAAPASLDLSRIALSDFCRLVYREVLHKSYYLDVPLLNDQELISIHLLDVTPQQLEKETKKILQLRGYKVDDVAGILHISKSVIGPESDSSKDMFVYRPSFRPVSYLLSIAETMFKPGAFLGRKSSQGPAFAQLSGGLNPGAQSPQLPGQQHSLQQNFDQGLNSQTSIEQDVIVFNGLPDEVERLKKVFAALDVPAGELLVNAIVLEVQRTARQGSAVDFVTSLIKGKLGLTLSGGASDFSSNAKIKFSLDGLDFSAVFAALSSDNRFKVLTSPRVRVRSDATARFTVGNETPVLGSVSYDSNGKAIQSVQYKSSGVIFELKPKIRGQVSDLHVSQQISQFVATTNGVNNSPTLTKRELSTDVLVSDGDLILLGGLDETKSTGNRSGVPMFPAFLDAVSEEETKTEIVLLLGIERINRN